MNRTESSKPFAGYPRVSSRGGRPDDKFHSPDFQRELIESCALREGVPLKMYPAEIDVSGGKAQRAILEEILQAIEDGELAGIVVAKLDRLSRLPARERIELIERIDAAGGRILSASENVDASTPEGRFVRDLFLGIARMDYERYAEGFERSKQNALRNGVYLARRAPVGYRFDESRKLVKSEHAETVAELFGMRAAGASNSILIDRLASATGEVYYPQSLEHLFRNRAYLGELNYRGKLVEENAHEPIVTEAQWRAAQRERRPGALKKSGTKSLLAGIARCASCGRKMGLDNSGSVPIYKCPRTPRGFCPAPASISASVLDEYVTGELLDWARGVGIADREYAVNVAVSELEAARQLLAEAEEAEEGWAVDSVGFSREAVRKGAVARQEATQAARERVQALEAADESATIRASLSGLWPELTVAERRQLIGAVVERVNVQRRWTGATVQERTHLVWKS